LFNDKELQLKPIDSESTVTIKKDLIMIWKIVEVIQLIS
ncbi:XRE family transcriptional regulator, partial [Listeria monocytogenes]|nr:XRE family transcriptional regulator [Listeria monocytogenes]